MVKSLPGCIVDFRSFTSGIRFLISILLILSVTVIGSARTVEHTVARGENLQRIAAQYGVSEEDILRANGVDRLYTGLKLTFEAPDLPPAHTYGYDGADGNSNSSKKSKKGMDPLELYGKILDLEEEASIAFDAKKYDKAVKCYDKLIKLESDNPTYYYNRGVSQYNRQKFRQAAEDIEMALGFPEASDFVKENGPDLLSDAKARHAAWQERQSQMWAGIIGSALVVAGTTAAVVLTEKAKSKQLESGGSSGYSSSSYSGGEDEDSGDSKNSGGRKLSETKNCHVCHGTGKCKACGSTKVGRGLGQTYHCNVCDDDGNCPTCGGSGQVVNNDAVRNNLRNQ